MSPITVSENGTATVEEALEKRDYQAERDEFLRWKSELEDQISQHEQEITTLNQEIDKARPRIPGATMICPSCECTSVEIMEKTGPGKSLYKCGICKNTYDLLRLYEVPKNIRKSNL